jgi:CheY-like chemotaxis protein
MPQVLLIDDSTALLPLLERAAHEQPGATLVYAANGREAFERLDLFAPDIIVLADTLAGSELLDLCERLASEAGTAGIIRCLVTSPGCKAPSERLSSLVHHVTTRPTTQAEFISLLDALASGEFEAAAGNGSATGNGSETRMIIPRKAALERPTSFSGHTGFFSLRNAVKMIESDRLTGIFRVKVQKTPVELYADTGRLLFATTRNFNLYLRGSDAVLSNVPLGAILEAQVRQAATSIPLFLTLASEHGIDLETAAVHTREHGQRLFAQLWASGRLNFEFETVRPLPSWVRLVKPTGDEADNWILSALRQLRADQLPPAALPDPASSAAYTRRGFDLVQRLKLNPTEARIADCINGDDDIPALASKCGLMVPEVRLALFRFVALELVELWQQAPPAPENGDAENSEDDLLQSVEAAS